MFELNGLITFRLQLIRLVKKLTKWNYLRGLSGPQRRQARVVTYGIGIYLTILVGIVPALALSERYEYNTMNYTKILKGEEYRILDKYTLDNQNFFVLERNGNVSPTLVDLKTYDSFFVNDTIVRMR